MHDTLLASITSFLALSFLAVIGLLLTAQFIDDMIGRRLVVGEESVKKILSKEPDELVRKTFLAAAQEHLQKTGRLTRSDLKKILRESRLKAQMQKRQEAISGHLQAQKTLLTQKESHE